MKKVFLFFVAISLCVIGLTIAPRISEAIEPCRYVTDTQGSGYIEVPIPPCGSCYQFDGENMIFLGAITQCAPTEEWPGCVAYGCKTWLSHCLESIE